MKNPTFLTRAAASNAKPSGFSQMRSAAAKRPDPRSTARKTATREPSRRPSRRAWMFDYSGDSCLMDIAAGARADERFGHFEERYDGEGFYDVDRDPSDESSSASLHFMNEMMRANGPCVSDAIYDGCMDEDLGSMPPEEILRYFEDRA